MRKLTLVLAEPHGVTETTLDIPNGATFTIDTVALNGDGNPAGQAARTFQLEDVAGILLDGESAVSLEEFQSVVAAANERTAKAEARFNELVDAVKSASRLKSGEAIVDEFLSTKAA